MRLSRGAPLARAIAVVLCVLPCLLGGAGCRERAARFMGVDSSTPLPLPAAEEPNQVHFSFTGPTSVTFVWRGSGRSVRLWSKDMAPRTVEAHEPSPKPFSSVGHWQEAAVTDLRPGTEYGYEVGRPRLPVPAFIHTPPAPGMGGFGFVATAGLGASIDFPEVLPTQRLITLAEPAFVLALGDLTFADIRSQTSVDRHFEDVMSWSLKAAYMPVWGEHEWQTPNRDDLRNYKGRFALPNAQASPGAPAGGCCGEDWYWFDYGNIRFISYPEPYTDATWEDWRAKAEPIFEGAESNAATAFTITMGHRPAYSSSQTEGDPRLRKLLDGFGARFHKYILNLSGHSRAYERTTPQAHVVHLATGVAGGELDHADTPCFWRDCKRPAFIAFRAIHHGFLRFSVQRSAFKVEAFCGASVPGRDDIHCAEGDIFDAVTFEAGAPPSAR
jgi:hypothetical protein